MKKYLLAGAALALASTGANAAIVTFNYSGGYHINGWVTGGSNGASINVVYGDGPNYGVSPQNKCVDGSITLCSALVPPRVNGDNGTYQTNVGGATPMANYAGSLTYDTSITFSYTDQSTLATETWYAVTGGSLAWTGTVGFEVLVNPGASGNVGGSFFDYSFANGNVNLITGVRTSTSKCDLGIAGQAIVGALLCGFANPATSYNYSNSGAYVKPQYWAGVRENGDGTIDLLMYGNRYTTTNSGNNLQERLVLAPIPVPAAVWLFGSALGLLGFARRKLAG